MLNALRGVIRAIGETVRFGLPVGAQDENGAFQPFQVEAGRFRSHFAFEIGGESKSAAVTAVNATMTFAADSGKFLRVTTDTDCWLRLDQPSAGGPAADPGASGVSIFQPAGETNYLVIPDSSQATVLSFIRVTADGNFYASIVA